MCEMVIVNAARTVSLPAALQQVVVPCQDACRRPSLVATLAGSSSPFRLVLEIPQKPF